MVDVICNTHCAVFVAVAAVVVGAHRWLCVHVYVCVHVWMCVHVCVCTHDFSASLLQAHK